MSGEKMRVSFDLDEVLVRMEVVMRRSESTVENTVLSYAGIELDTELNCVTVNGNELKLTSKEMNLLRLFLENPKKTFSKANLYESVWNETYIYEDNTINVYLSNLRSKLKKAGDIDYIETVWGIGYKLKAI
jgi:DNA-binding response OmpR family regulator